MRNVYQPSKLFSPEAFKELERAFENAWIADTAYPDSVSEWSKDNKAIGQCAPTALVVHDMYGGRILYNRENFHLWNELPDGTQQDLSRCQFKDGRVFTITKYKTKEEVLNDERGIGTNLAARYQLLKSRVNQKLGE